jgi:hypothetical protein
MSSMRWQTTKWDDAGSCVILKTKFDHCTHTYGYTYKNICICVVVAAGWWIGGGC